MKDRVWELLARFRGDSSVTTLDLADRVIEAVGDNARDELIRQIEEVLDDPPSRGRAYMAGWADARDALARELRR